MNSLSRSSNGAGRRIAVLALQTLAALAIFLGAFGWLQWERTLHPSSITRYTVEPGDTLWSIAEQLDPNSDPRLVCDWILSHNNINGDEPLSPGEMLVVPVKG